MTPNETKAVQGYLISLSNKYANFAENAKNDDMPTTHSIFRTVSVLLAEESLHLLNEATEVPPNESR